MSIPLGGIDGLERLLKSTVVGDCDKALRQLISKIAKSSGVKASKADVISLFNSIRNQTEGGGIFVDVVESAINDYVPPDATFTEDRPAGGGGLSWVVPRKSGPPTRVSAVFIKSRYSDSPREDLDRYKYGYLATAIHELIHQAPEQGGRFYSHDEMNRGARLLGFEDFGRFVKENCFPAKFRWPM